MKHKLLSILLHPAFIALVISFLIIYFLPEIFQKYKVELVSSEINSDSRIYFQDLNNDHQSEKIITYSNTLGNACFEVHNPDNGLIDQWNFTGKFFSSFKPLWFFDANTNGFKEIYLITQSQDSIFLNIEEPFVKEGIHKKKILIDVIKAYHKQYKIFANMYGAEDVNGNGEKEVFFNLSRGFTGNPRSTYKYNLSEDKIYKSPHLTNPSYIEHIIDLDGDGFKEIITCNYTAGNTIDSVYTKRSDYNLWLMVLNSDLSFRFQPKKIGVYPSTIHSIFLKDKNEKYQIVSLINSNNTELSANKLMIFSDKGELIRRKTLPKGNIRIYSESNKNRYFTHNMDTGLIQYNDKDLNKLESFFIEPNFYLFSLDLDKDGETEWLVKSTDHKKTLIYNNDFTNPVEIRLPEVAVDTDYFFGLKEISKNENQIYFQKGRYTYVYSYKENPLYYFKYLFYFGIFLLVLALVELIRKGQRIQMRKQRAIEDQISKLQIKTIKNQVDPHFVFNAVNTISEMTLTEDKVEADRFISKFSKLMRETLQKSDKISTTLQEELDYVENYIQLQQIRFNNGFDYQIKKDLNVNYQTHVPNHVIYTYVENAIKHGLSGKADGSLKISVHSKGEDIFITIDNNGGGIDSSPTPKKNSTGNGMKIMEKMYVLYEKLYRKKITHQMTEIKDDEGNITGVSVQVIISG